MAPLAEIFLERGYRISGSDLVSNAKTRHLAQCGCKIHIGHNAGNILPETNLAVFSSAVTPDNPEYRECVCRGIPLLRRGELLGKLGKLYQTTFAVSGAHGKSSISALLARMLSDAFPGTGFMIGAQLQDGSAPARSGDGSFFVTEVDESDGTHTAFTATCAIIPNLDDDHAWSVGGVDTLHRNFRQFANQAEHLIYFESPLADKLFSSHTSTTRLDKEQTNKLLRALGVDAFLHGFHRTNAALAATAALYAGVPVESIAESIRNFRGVDRRMTIRYSHGSQVVIEDYAHHPVELRASLELLHETYPHAKLTVLFQPHRYARLERYFEDFAAILRNGCDRVFLLPVFAAWTENGPIGSKELVNAIGSKAELLPPDYPYVAKRLLQTAESPEHNQRQTDPSPAVKDVIAVIGAGDLDQVFAFLPCGN